MNSYVKYFSIAVVVKKRLLWFNDLNEKWLGLDLSLFSALIYTFVADWAQRTNQLNAVAVIAAASCCSRQTFWCDQHPNTVPVLFQS